MKIEELVSAIEKRISELESVIEDAKDELHFERECLSRISKLDVGNQPSIQLSDAQKFELAKRCVSPQKSDVERDQIVRLVLKYLDSDDAKIRDILVSQRLYKKNSSLSNVRCIAKIRKVYEGK